MNDWRGRQRIPRYPISIPVLYEPKDSAFGRAGAGWTRDLGEGGVCLELTEHLGTPTPLRVFLRTDQGGFLVDGQVVWSGKSAAPEVVLHGVKFTEVTVEHHQALQDLIARKGELLPVAVRVPVRLTVLCRRKGDAGPAIPGRTGNVSRGGLLLRIPQVLPPGTILDIILQASGEALRLQGSVVWVESRPPQVPGEPIRHGLQFTQISQTTTMTLARILAQAL